jgi:hypothetical protein
MPFLLVGFVLYLLYRRYTNPTASSAIAPASGQDVQPAAYQGPGSPPTDPSTAPTVTWKELPEGSQLQPGFVYRASAPPQGMITMMAIPSTLASRSFTGVTIYKPGAAFPNDWPDTGNLLRIEAALPLAAQPQEFSLDGVRVWQQVPSQTVGQVVKRVLQTVRHTEDSVREQIGAVVAAHPRPKRRGVYDGLLRRPPPE